VVLNTYHDCIKGTVIGYVVNSNDEFKLGFSQERQELRILQEQVHSACGGIGEGAYAARSSITGDEDFL
jgi:hypothetical protein